MLRQRVMAFLLLGCVAVRANADEGATGMSTPDGQEEEIQQLAVVEVTGTRLKRVDTEGLQPLTIISRAEIEAGGRVSIADLLQQLPENSFGSSNLRAGFDSPTLNLRGIGAQYTLILVNGVPLVSEPRLAGGDVQNISLIPLAAVDHIEILHEGASAIYGSRAMCSLPLRGLVGIEADHERYAVNNDLPSTQGDVLGVSADNSSARRDVNSLFGELDFNAGGALEAKAAYRYDRYSDQGGGSSPKLAALWRINADWLLRASIGEGFHAADLESLNQSRAEFTASGIADTLRCDQRGACFYGPYTVLSVANPYLRPETARQRNIGLVYSPSTDFSAGIDYYSVSLRHGILPLSAQAVMDNDARCVESGLGCSLYHEGRVVRDDAGLVQLIEITTINANVIRTTGANLSITAKRKFDLGELDLNVVVARILNYEIIFQDVPSAGNQAGFVNQPRYRIAAMLGWKSRRWQANLVGNYIAGQVNCNAGDPDPVNDCQTRIAHYATVDLQVRRDLPWRGAAILGIRNLTDRNPPLDPLGNGYNGALYDIAGRTFYLRYEQDF
ncbi:TonB-dependent receptor [Rudaea sp.]|uniref:TonB-dependent receptor n=1 Tax=Rudaea sp. TaxID=2136325 RepID=UPI002ED28C6A